MSASVTKSEDETVNTEKKKVKRIGLSVQCVVECETSEKNARTSKHLQYGGNGVYRYTDCKYTKFDENRNVFE